MYRVLRDGAERRLVWGSDSSGTFRALDYYDALDPKDQAKFEPLFDRMAATGLIMNTEKFRMEGGGIGVFKIHKHRLASFFDGRDVVLIHGFGKKTTRAKKESREIGKATQLRTDYLERKRR